MPGSNQMPRRPAWWGENLDGTAPYQDKRVNASGADASSGNDRWSGYLREKEAEIAATDAGQLPSADLRLPRDWDYETIQAVFEPAKSKGATAVASPEDLEAVYQNQNMVAVPWYGGAEKMGFLMPGGNGGYSFQQAGNLHTYGTKTSHNATGDVPAGAKIGMHGHVPDKGDGFVDDLSSTSGLGDSQTLNLHTPIPMATVTKNGKNEPYLIGVHEIVNGRLQFRAPVGSMTPKQRSQIQRNLDEEQKKFYK